MFRESVPRREDRWSYIAAGLAALVAIVVVDATSDSIVLISLLVLAPLVASSGGTRRGTALVALLAVAASIALGWADDLAGTRRHWVGITTTVLGSALAMLFARTRELREAALARSLPIVRRADRLKAALATGRMGEWSWDSRTGAVTWDSNVAMLFGLSDGEFGGTFEEWIERVDERDREMVQQTVADGVARREPFRFDHRCVWPDGSVHWLEGIGDVVVADEGEGEGEAVIGAFGLAIDVDERHREIEERSRLLESEQHQRERMEYLAKVNDVLANSLDTGEIVHRVTESVIPDLAEWCSIVVSIDRRRDRPSITVAHRDPDKIKWAEQIQRDYPYDPDAAFGAAAVIRSGVREVIPEVDPAVFALPGGDVLRKAGLRSVVTVPIFGALGTLGSLQLIRCDDQPLFATADVDLIEELAGRVGAALNSAILFERQTRSRAALDTLQQVSGRIAAAATSDKIIHAVLAYGSAGIRSDAASLFMLDDDGDPKIKESTVPVDEVIEAAQRLVAEQAVDASTVIVTDMNAGAALGVPLRIMNRITGALVFTFDETREFAPEELSMLVTLGSRCAGALERASLYERDRDIALTFQRRLMPGLPKTPGWVDLAAWYRPATGLAIGGDWYQVLDGGGGRVAAVVGDAVGHGLVAAAAMGQLRASIATAVVNNADPDRMIAAVDLFAMQGADTLGASVAYVLFDPAGPARYASAGHVPVLRVPANGRGELLEGGRRPLLGFRLADEPDHTVAADFPFDPGDVVVMFTDGLVERRGESIDTGLQRLLAAAEESRALTPQAIGELLVDRLTDGYDPDDDIALLVIKRR